MYSMRYMHRYDKDTTACRSKKQNYERGTPADFLTVSAYNSFCKRSINPDKSPTQVWGFICYTVPVTQYL